MPGGGPRWSSSPRSGRIETRVLGPAAARARGTPGSRPCLRHPPGRPCLLHPRGRPCLLHPGGRVARAAGVSRPPCSPGMRPQKPVAELGACGRLPPEEATHSAEFVSWPPATPARVVASAGSRRPKAPTSREEGKPRQRMSVETDAADARRCIPKPVIPPETRHSSRDPGCSPKPRLRAEAPRQTGGLTRDRVSRAETAASAGVASPGARPRLRPEAPVACRVPAADRGSHRGS